MTHKRFYSAGLICLFCVFAALVSCTKNDECTGIIYTYTSNASGAKVPVGGCELKIGETDFAPEVQRSVVTDASGHYEGTWVPRQVRLLVEAKKPINATQYYFGVAFLVLEPGNTTELEIPLEVTNY
ncbi:MAG: hypothetical protein FWH36_08760 [Lentimicrobiaceae bacterium]|nr:hypothetical protein [Lentimicrobiaceae bacterium]